MTPKLLPACTALALLGACATHWDVDRYEAPEADVAGRSTYAWRTGEIGAPLVRDPALIADTEARMRALVAAELQQKGYREVASPAAADMVVSFQASGTRRYVEADERRIGAPSPNELLTPGGVPPRPASELPGEKSVRQGNVIVFAEDPASSRILWRGLISAEVRASSRDRAVDEVLDMGRHIAQEFPARRGGT
jgi:hypothetical protein